MASESASSSAAPEPLPLHLTVTAGLLMGSADAVPGVSGGTIALIVGAYERLIESIALVLKTPVLVRSQQGRAALVLALRFLVPLALGILTALYVVTLFLVGSDADPGALRQPESAPFCYAFFFGLVLVSLREPWRRIRIPRARHWVAVLAGSGAAALFVGLSHSAAEPETWMLLYGGALAISVMLLPGVSGSLMLLMLGQYTTVTAAFHNRAWVPLLVFACGLAIGVALFVPLLRRLLRRHHDVTLAALTGLMAGSLRALWPWKDSYDPKAGPMTNQGVGADLVWVLAFALLGAFAVWLLARLERRILAASPSYGEGAP